jgi:hypothetical protein
MFLTVVTRHFVKRPNLLAACQQSLDAQRVRDFEHVLLTDDVGRGVAWANAQFAAHADQVRGEYVLMLDDDDALADPDAVAILRDAAEARPDLVFFRADHGELGILPDGAVWKKRPVRGHVGGIDFITRSDVWKAHISAFSKAHSLASPCGDYYFLESVWETKPSIVWVDRVLTRVQRISQGAPE